MKCILRIILPLLIAFTSTSNTLASSKPIVEIKTNMGSIIIELHHRRAPATVKNFLYYVKKDFYSNTLFHRVMLGFMIQGGGFDVSLVKKTTRSPIRNESNNGLKNSKGTIAMARTDDFDSATSQFYINLKENRQLNATYKTLGYTVFGEVIEGMDVVMQIAHVSVSTVKSIGQNVPNKPVIIESITLLEAEPSAIPVPETQSIHQSKEKK